MITQQTIYIIELISVLLAIGCTAVIAFQKPSEGQKLALLSSALVFLVCLGYMGTSGADDIYLLVYSTKIEYLGACNVFVVMLAMYMLLLDIRLPKKVFVSLAIAGIVLTAFPLTFDVNTLFYRSYKNELVNGIPELVKVYGPMHTVYVIMVVAYTLAFIGLLFYRLIGKHKTKMKNPVLFLLVAVLPSACWLVRKIYGASFDLTPFGLLASNIILAYLITQKFYDINDIALDKVFDTVDSAIIVFDVNEGYVMANEPACRLFPGLGTLKTGDILAEQNPDMKVVFDDLRLLFEREKKKSDNIKQYDTVQENLATYTVGDIQYKSLRKESKVMQTKKQP